MKNLLQKIRESDHQLLKALGEDVQTWSKLKHNKEDLETFLAYNLTELSFKTNDNEDSVVICTSNTPLIKVFSAAKKEDKKKFVSLRNSGIRTNDTKSVTTWDLVDNKFKTINIRSWQILNFITIKPKNVLLLDEMLHKLLNM